MKLNLMRIGVKSSDLVYNNDSGDKRPKTQQNIGGQPKPNRESGQPETEVDEP